MLSPRSQASPFLFVSLCLYNTRKASLFLFFGFAFSIIHGSGREVSSASVYYTARTETREAWERGYLLNESKDFDAKQITLHLMHSKKDDIDGLDDR